MNEVDKNKLKSIARFADNAIPNVELLRIKAPKEIQFNISSFNQRIQMRNDILIISFTSDNNWYIKFYFKGFIKLKAIDSVLTFGEKLLDLINYLNIENINFEEDKK